MSHKVLIIDDSELVLQMLDMVCKDSGYQTLACANIAEAQREVATQTPDAVFIDLNLPDLEHDDPVAALRQELDLTDIPIIVVSGLEPEDLEQRAAEIGADGYVSKDEGMPGIQEDLPPMLERLLS